jgi:hypothetical protein
VADLAADLAGLLRDEPVGLSGRVLAGRLHRRRGHVLAALHADSRFEQVGRGRGSRWRLADREPQGTAREPQGRDERRGLTFAPTLDDQRRLTRAWWTP